MQCTWLGHSSVLLSGTKKVIIDPFIEGGSVADLDPDLVAITHGHADHMGEAVALNKKTIAITEIAKYLQAKGLTTESMNIGGTMKVDGVQFTMTPAMHSGWIEEKGIGAWGGAAAGYVIGMDGVRVYHAGDTGLFLDMKLIGDLYKPDLALLPIGGRYTMGIEEAMMAAEFIGARLVIPIHYNTWPKIAADPLQFKKAIERTTDMTVMIPRQGEPVEIGPPGQK